jgi:hypothetical protein
MAVHIDVQRGLSGTGTKQRPPVGDASARFRRRPEVEDMTDTARQQPKVVEIMALVLRYPLGR